MTNCSQVEPLMRTTSKQICFPEMVLDSLCRIYLVMRHYCYSSCLGGRSPTILEVNMLHVWVRGCSGYLWSVVVWNRLDVLLKILHTLKTCNICSIVLCDKITHFRQGKVLTNRFRPNCELSLRYSGKIRLCVHRKTIRPLSSARENGRKNKCCIYIFLNIFFSH